MLKVATGVSVLVVCGVAMYGFLTGHMSERIIGATFFAIIVIYISFLAVTVKKYERAEGGGSTNRKKDITATGSDGGTSGGCGDGGC